MQPALQSIAESGSPFKRFVGACVAAAQPFREGLDHPKSEVAPLLGSWLRLEKVNGMIERNSTVGRSRTAESCTTLIPRTGILNLMTLTHYSFSEQDHNRGDKDHEGIVTGFAVGEYSGRGSAHYRRYRRFSVGWPVDSLSAGVGSDHRGATRRSAYKVSASTRRRSRINKNAGGSDDKLTLSVTTLCGAVHLFVNSAIHDLA
jgi:hypothetical protein